ncbi:MAG: PEGA domain-containing protein [Methanofollis sp.]|uniref:PEGA domain-containing protein n=1 Tax=Methanofollis sp. TaxID=2052835 RepID=UPI00260E4D71|nr:PEGA domain-containing protein [Methanofollis sp.]MDD4254451.1 PEGA domain-containing protein [Methanofollis sp.]
MDRTQILILGIALLVCTVPAVASAAAETIGGDQGYYAVHCNVDGAQVFFDNDLKGEITSGRLLVPVYVTGTPYKTISIEADGYETYTTSIVEYPAKGETVDINANLQQAPIGGDTGAYLVKSNVEGAKVFFDSDLKGEIANGELVVRVYVTGTPYKSISVEADGYETYTAPVTEYPAKSETVTITATLQQAPIGGDMGAFLVKSNVEGAKVAFDGEAKGEIKNGELLVRVYVTGTPYKTVTVSAEGYAPQSVGISQYPAKGETVEIDTTLTPVTPTQSPLSPFAVLGSLCICGAFLLLRREN